MASLFTELKRRNVFKVGATYPDLTLQGILGGAEKGFDPQVLFDPFEKELYLHQQVGCKIASSLPSGTIVPFRECASNWGRINLTPLLSFTLVPVCD